MGETTLKPTLLVWWRLGYEHGDEEMQANPPEVVRQHLAKKTGKYRQTKPECWRWYQVEPNLIVERWDDSPNAEESHPVIYYLLDKGLAVIENLCFDPPHECWKWVIRTADFMFDEELDTWVMKDLFLDICVESDAKTYQVFDLPDLGCAVDTGIISKDESGKILERADWIARQIAGGNFPLPEVERARAACRQLGW